MIFARQQLHREEEFLHHFQGGSEELAGTIRIGSYSSIMRSLLIPHLAPLLEKNPRLSIEFSSYEVVDLPGILRSGRADLVIMDAYSSLPGVEEIKLGEEEFVIIERKNGKSPQDVYLDHGPSDNATEAFFKFQGQKFNERRAFMGDVYGIMDGVSY